MKLTIKQKDLKAVSYAMPEKDIRYYLNGVFIESNGRETRLVATDGNRLHAVAVSTKNAELVEPISVILPAVFVKALLKAKFGKQQKKEFVLETDGQHVEVDFYDGTKAVCKGIDGRFPDYRRVIPQECSVGYAHLNPYYRLDAAEVWAAYAEIGDVSKAPDFAHNGDGPAMLAYDGFVAVVMPIRDGVSCDALDPRFKAELEKPAKRESA